MAEASKPQPKNQALAYVGRVSFFYFTARLRTVLTSIYLVSAIYAALYYLENVELAAKFIVYTIVSSTALLSISHLVWGIVFVLTLVFPFTISMYAVFLLYRIWEVKSDWSWHAKFLTTILFVAGAIAAIVIADDIIRFVASQPELRDFIEDHNLNGRI